MFPASFKVGTTKANFRIFDYAYQARPGSKSKSLRWNCLAHQLFQLRQVFCDFAMALSKVYWDPEVGRFQART